LLIIFIIDITPLRHYADIIDIDIDAIITPLFSLDYAID
jgi:hypothetical protein